MAAAGIGLSGLAFALPAAGFAAKAGPADHINAAATTTAIAPGVLFFIMFPSVHGTGCSDLASQESPSTVPLGSVAVLSAPPGLPLRKGNIVTSIVSPAFRLLCFHPNEFIADGLEHSSA